MCDSGSSEKNSDDEFDTIHFLKTNSNLFTVLGVFGAISVYFTQLEVEVPLRRLGLVSSLSIFLLTSFHIYRASVPSDVDKTPFDYLIKPRRDRFGLTLFLVPFAGVVVTVATIVLNYLGTVIFLFQFVALVIGISTVVYLVDILDFPDDADLEVGKGRHVVPLALYILRNASYASIIGGGFVSIALLRDWIGVESLQAIQVSAPIVSILSGYFAGLLFGGLLFSAVAGMLLYLHFLIRRLRQSDQLESVAKGYVRWFTTRSVDDIEELGDD